MQGGRLDQKMRSAPWRGAKLEQKLRTRARVLQKVQGETPALLQMSHARATFWAPVCVFGLTPQKSTSVFLVVSHSRPPPPAPSEGSGGGGGAWASHGRRRPVPRPRLGCDALRHTCRPCATGIQSCLKRRWAVHGKFVQPSALSFCVSVVLLSAFRFCLRFVCIHCLRLILSQNTVSGK